MYLPIYQSIFRLDDDYYDDEDDIDDDDDDKPITKNHFRILIFSLHDDVDDYHALMNDDKTKIFQLRI